ncbi:MAG: PHP domain-containing protein [Chloroflexi bacterium]|nr:PHP domain-containing protein [Chloroflexota bacterium]
MTTPLWKVEFHCHTVYSPDSLNWIPALIKTARQRGLDRVMITDHNTIRGGLAARKADPDLFVVGEEIKARGGAEILGYFVQEEIPAGMPFEVVIARLREQGAVIGLPHPLDRYRGRWKAEELQAALALVDAVEGFNARCLVKEDNIAAETMAQRRGLAVFSGSDAHLPGEVGSAYTLLPPFSTPEELKVALQSAQLVRRQSSNLVHLGSRYAVLYKRLFKGSRCIQDLNEPDARL